MLNSKPNNANYNQGNYIPKYKDKVIKLNKEREMKDELFNQAVLQLKETFAKKDLDTLKTLQTPLVLPSKVLLIMPVLVSHTRTVSSHDPEQMYFPSGENDTQLTLSV